MFNNELISNDSKIDFNFFVENELLHNHFTGILAIDNETKIFFCNSFFLRILELDAKDVVGRYVCDVIDDCKLYDTIVQGSSSWGEIFKLNGKKFIISRYPIKDGKNVVGAVLKTIFPDMIIGRQVSRKLTNPNEIFRAYNDHLYTCMDIIGESEQMLFVKKLARKAARSCSNLLITGESGTGKGIVAEAIHSRSVRRDRPFIKVNCAAIPDTLLESELFGYVEGAFTGARKKGKPGKFEMAIGGTIFLDEIGDMPFYMQAKLLQVIQDKKVERIGGTESIDLDVRIISATNQDIQELVREKKFREDLYYRLKVLEIKMPPLRESVEDIPLYVEGLLNRINKKIGSDAVGLTKESIEILQNYNWPGNVRQLENFLEQAVNYSDEAIIDINKLPIRPWENYDEFYGEIEKNISIKNQKDLNYTIEKTEREMIIEAINKCNGNKSKAAKLLNIHRSALYKKIKRLEIQL